MELYFKTAKGDLRSSTLKEVIYNSLLNSDLNVSSGASTDDSASWLAVDKESEKDSQLVTTNLMFSPDGNQLIDINVYTTPIKRIVDEDNTRQLV